MSNQILHQKLIRFSSELDSDAAVGSTQARNKRSQAKKKSAQKTPKRIPKPKKIPTEVPVPKNLTPAGKLSKMRSEIFAKSSAAPVSVAASLPKKFGPLQPSVGVARSAHLDLSESSSSEDEASVVKPAPRPAAVAAKPPEKKVVPAAAAKANVELSDEEDDDEMALKLVTLVTFPSILSHYVGHLNRLLHFP